MAQESGTVVVTGGAGFIGSHLCDALLLAGRRVICLDNLITGSSDNLKEARSNSNFNFIEQDVIVPLARETLEQLSDVSHIFHLASPASVIDYQKFPEETALVNSLGTINMLDLAKKRHARFLFASTSEVYGDPKEHPQKETYWGNVNPNGVRSCYDESKRFGEAMTMVYRRKFDLDIRIVRIFNTYGPRMRKTDGRVISNFINQAIGGAPLTVYGDGSQTRSFCYVSDLVDGIMRLMFSERAAGVVVNLGNPEEYTMLQLAQKIKEKVVAKSEITFSELPQDDPIKRRPDSQKAETLLDWRTTVNLDEGLDKTIEYYKKAA